jgi:hypothetical protein
MNLSGLRLGQDPAPGSSTFSRTLDALVKASKQLKEYKNAPGTPDALVARAAERVHVLEQNFKTYLELVYPKAYGGSRAAEQLQKWKAQYGDDLPEWIERLYPMTLADALAEELAGLKKYLDELADDTNKANAEYAKAVEESEKAAKKYEAVPTEDNRRIAEETLRRARSTGNHFDTLSEAWRDTERRIRSVEDKIERSKGIPAPPGPYEAMVRPPGRPPVATVSPSLPPAPPVATGTGRVPMAPSRTMPTGMVQPEGAMTPTPDGGAELPCPPGQFRPAPEAPCRGSVGAMPGIPGGMPTGGGVPVATSYLSGRRIERGGFGASIWS